MPMSDLDDVLLLPDEAVHLKLHKEGINKMVLMPDDDTIVTAGQDRKLAVCSIRSAEWKGSFVEEVDGYYLHADVTVVDKDIVASIGDGKYLRVWRVSTRIQLYEKDLLDVASACASLGNYHLLAAIMEGENHWKLVEFRCDGNILRTCRKIPAAHRNTVTCIAVHRTRFVTISLDCTAKVWDIATFRCLATFTCRHEQFRSVVMNDDHIVAGTDGNVLEVYDAHMLQLIRDIQARRTTYGGIMAIQLVEFETAVLSGSSDGTIAVHTLPSGICKWRLKVGIPVYGIAAVSSGIVAAAGGGRHDIRIFETPLRQALMGSERNSELHEHQKLPSSEVFISHAGPDKHTIAVPLYDKLCEREISSFLDMEELKPGDDALQSMIRKMQTAPIAVVITSPEFCARKWTMEELKCFLRRDERAKDRARRLGGSDGNMPAPGEGGRPIMIPVFYRLSVAQCRYLNLGTDVTDEDEHNMKRFYDMLSNLDPELRVLRDSMNALTVFTGIENELGATNDNTEEMEERRANLVEKIVAAVERASRIVRENGKGCR